MPDEYTDVMIFTRCLRVLSNKLFMPRPGSFPQPSTVSLFLPTLMSCSWICVCFFLDTINSQTFCFCLFLSTCPSNAFYKILPTLLQGFLVLVVGKNIPFLSATWNFAKLPCFHLLRMTLSQGTRQRGKSGCPWITNILSPSLNFTPTQMSSCWLSAWFPFSAPPQGSK